MDRVRTAVEDRRRAEDRDEALGRERRDARREAYQEVGGALISIGDYASALAPYALSLSTMQQTEWDVAEPMLTWISRHLAAAEVFRSLSRLTSIYGSESLLEAARYLTHIYAALAPPSKFRDSEGHYTHRLTQDGELTRMSLASFDRAHQLREGSLFAASITGLVVMWGLGQLRHEMAGEPKPDPLPFNIGCVG